jgi:hypothetical protein
MRQLEGVTTFFTEKDMLFLGLAGGGGTMHFRRARPE